ncbi:MFS general substrate transporter [Lophiostoma macrostomum CBS 122681]|uniref:MFS general substrate transporter n=1 Tax=Lophiostoma macrostomum CBS 122681 TaxID=1314788 RepID=A0A6A6TGU9_9PLEO|nr:MFS general substrate transporter [Lophiostoma macrostomum CBS 122681]
MDIIDRPMSPQSFVAVPPPGLQNVDTKTECEQMRLDEPRPEAKGREIHGFRWLAICVALYTSCILYGLDTTIAADVQGPIIERFGHVEQLAWVGAGFPLGSVCVILPLGNLYSSFNIKRVFLITVVLFEVGSAICGAAPTMSTLIIGRVIAGVGGSGIYLGTLNYFLALTTPEERSFYMALIGSCWGVGAILGPVIGGAFATSSATWRWAFYINLVIFALSAPAYIFYLPSIHPSQGISVRARIARLDFLGFLLGAGTWFTFLLAITMAGGQWKWDDGRTIATFVVFGVILVAYVLQQAFAVLTDKANRAFPAHLLRERTQVLLYIQTSAGITTLYVAIYFIPIYFQFTNGDSALKAAVRLLPFVIVAISVNLASGYFLGAIKVYMLIYVIGGIFLTVGGALLTTYLKPSTSTGTLYGLCVITAIGSGLAMLTGYSIASLTTKPENASAALSMQNVSQLGGQVIALAVAGQIFHSSAVRNLRAVLSGQSFSEQDIESAVAGVQSKVLEQVQGPLREEVILALVNAMQKAFVLIPVAGGVMLLAALCMKREKLFGVAAVAAA